jgi:hypothetical protein
LKNHSSATIVTSHISKSATATTNRQPFLGETTITAAASFGDDSTSNSMDSMEQETDTPMDAGARKRPRESRDSSARASQTTQEETLDTNRDLPASDNEETRDQEGADSASGNPPELAPAKSDTMKPDTLIQQDNTTSTMTNTMETDTSAVATTTVEIRNIVIRHGRKLRCSDASASSSAADATTTTTGAADDQPTTNNLDATTETKTLTGRQSKRAKKDNAKNEPWYVSGVVDDDSDTDLSILEAEPYELQL